MRSFASRERERERERDRVTDMRNSHVQEKMDSEEEDRGGEREREYARKSE